MKSPIKDKEVTAYIIVVILMCIAFGIALLYNNTREDKPSGLCEEQYVKDFGKEECELQKEVEKEEAENQVDKTPLDTMNR